jgi:hypothetical protein
MCGWRTRPEKTIFSLGLEGQSETWPCHASGASLAALIAELTPAMLFRHCHCRLGMLIA